MFSGTTVTNLVVDSPCSFLELTKEKKKKQYMREHLFMICQCQHGAHRTIPVLLHVSAHLSCYNSQTLHYTVAEI